MTKRSKRPSLKDANFRLPEDLLPKVLSHLNKMEPSGKTDYLREVVLSKFVSSDTAPSRVRRSRAINKWLACERNNEGTNVRLMTVDADYNILPRVGYASFMSTVRRIVQSVIGVAPPLAALDGAFSGGATTSRRRMDAHPALKYTGKAHVTERALPYAIQTIVGSKLWAEHLDELTPVEGNVMFTVSKSTEIDRCCCKEPDLNMYLQKGVGMYIRQRLRSVGIDLNDQSRNRRLAHEGSVSGQLATLDLSSASDSITTELVFQSVPTAWYTLLDDLRSPVTVIDGEVHRNEMFSSMGNGFTFELESLLFYAVARATAYHLGVSGVISVYGDDMIVPVPMAHYLIFVLSFLGFETNVSKSFIEGSFRESCGGHYSSGLDVTPFYVRKPITHLIDLIHFLNSLRAWAKFDGIGTLDPEVEDLWVALSALVPRRFWGGTDHSDKTRLVSLYQPKTMYRLAELQRERCNGPGGYLLWLDTLSERKSFSDPVVTSSRQIGQKVYRARKVADSSAVTDTYFFSEVVPPVLA